MLLVNQPLLLLTQLAVIIITNNPTINKTFTTVGRNITTHLGVLYSLLLTTTISIDKPTIITNNLPIMVTYYYYC